MLSVGSSRWGMAARTDLPRALLSQKRHASYSKNPMKKDGSFESLIYNDALFKNKLHVMDRNRIKAPETWKLGPGDLKKTAKMADEEVLQIPDHRYRFYASPFVNNNGYYVGQKIPYDDILPRCKGKLHGLEWKSVSEEDRYTARNLFIRTHTEKDIYTTHAHRDDKARKELNWGPMFIWIIPFFLIWQAGWPADNNRSMWCMNPDDAYTIGTNTNPVTTWPVIGHIWHFFFSGQLQMHHQYFEQYKYPLWTEAETGVPSVLGNMTNWTELAKLSPSWIGEFRDNGIVKPTPTKRFRDDYQLYFDGKEGPDRIGHYGVKLWKTGEKLKYATDDYNVGTSTIMHPGHTHPGPGN